MRALMWILLIITFWITTSSAAPQFTSTARYHWAGNLSLQRPLVVATQTLKGVTSQVIATGDGDYDKHYFSIRTIFAATNNTDIINSEIYAKAYLSNPHLPEITLFSSAAFTLDGNGDRQRYEIVTTFNHSLAADEYKFRVELLSAQNRNVLAPFFRGDDEAPNYINLESRDYDISPGSLHGIYNVDIAIYGDADYDGHYVNLDVNVDADTVHNSDWVFLQFLLRNSAGDWRVIGATSDFLIYGYSATDIYHSHLTLPLAFFPDHYDLRVALFDSASGYFLDSYGPTPSHSNLPLESARHDQYILVHSSTMTSGIVLLLVFALFKRARLGEARVW